MRGSRGETEEEKGIGGGRSSIVEAFGGGKSGRRGKENLGEKGNGKNLVEERKEDQQTTVVKEMIVAARRRRNWQRRNNNPRNDCGGGGSRTWR